MGTFNYAESWGHITYDMLPYWVYGNSPNDDTPFLRRVYPDLQTEAERFADGIDWCHRSIINYLIPFGEAFDRFIDDLW